MRWKQQLGCPLMGAGALARGGEWMLVALVFFLAVL